ncbi:hypothetical protein FQN60_008893, partial [Etheostoma spectabile]
ISKNIPTTKDVEPLLEIDGDIRSFEVFLSSRTPVLAARDVDMFLPCTGAEGDQCCYPVIPLSPLPQWLVGTWCPVSCGQPVGSALNVRAAREQMHLGGVTYPTLPLQEAVPRPQSGYGQHSAACSPAGSFAGSLPPQPHSAYFNASSLTELCFLFPILLPSPQLSPASNMRLLKELFPLLLRDR